MKLFVPLGCLLFALCFGNSIYHAFSTKNCQILTTNYVPSIYWIHVCSEFLSWIVCFTAQWFGMPKSDDLWAVGKVWWFITPKPDGLKSNREYKIEENNNIIVKILETAPSGLICLYCTNLVLVIACFGATHTLYL